MSYYFKWILTPARFELTRMRFKGERTTNELIRNWCYRMGEYLKVWKIKFLPPWREIKKNYKFPIRINLSNPVSLLQIKHFTNFPMEIPQKSDWKFRVFIHYIWFRFLRLLNNNMGPKIIGSAIKIATNNTPHIKHLNTYKIVWKISWILTFSNKNL